MTRPEAGYEKLVRSPSGLIQERMACVPSYTTLVMHSSGLITCARSPVAFTVSVVSRPNGSWMLVILPDVASYESVVRRPSGSVTKLTRPLPS